MNSCKSCVYAKKKRPATYRERMHELKNEYGNKLIKLSGCDREYISERTIKCTANGNGWGYISALAGQICIDREKNDEIELAVEFTDKLINLILEYEEKRHKIDTA